MASLDAATQDWTWATLPVEDQGQCGSCWAFAGNTVLESTKYIHDSYTNANAQKEFLSQQFPVDCVPYADETYMLLGCNGGDAERMWEYYMDHGTVAKSLYPYTSGATGVTGQSCQAQPDQI